MKTPCDQNKVVELYKSGKSINDLCGVFDRAPNSIYVILKKHNVLRTKKEGLRLAKEAGKIYRRKPIDDLLEDKESFIKEYETQSLTEIAVKYNAERKRLVKACRRFGVPIKRWGEKIHKIQSQIRESKLDQRIIDPNWMRVEYIDNQRGIDDIASELGCSITAVRNRLKRFDIPIRPQKKFGREKEPNKKSHGINVIYKPMKCSKEVMFRSMLECAYAVYLDSLGEVVSWDYETSWIWYLDSFSGKEKKYICDFKVVYVSRIEHVEVKPIDLQTLADKYLYAQRQLQGWRWITEDELNRSIKLFSIPNDRVICPVKFSEHKKKFIIWSKEDFEIPKGYRVISKLKKYNHIYQYRIINDNLIINRPKIVHYDRPQNMQDKLGKIIILNLDKILDLIKQDMTQFGIAAKFKVNYRTISKFLEDRSYVVRWGGSSSKHNEIRYATKLIWPLEELPPRETIRNRTNYKWDNYSWLYDKYINKRLSTRVIGKIVGKSGRLVLKKLRKYKIEIRSLNNGPN
jgi:hypothetical protein